MKQTQRQKYSRKAEIYQQLALPIAQNIEIAEDEPVFVANAQLEELDYRKLYRAYSPTGRKSAAEPRIMFKLLVYGYLCGIYSTRKLEQACRVTEGEYVLVDLRSAPKVVIQNEGWHPFFSPGDQCFSVGGKFYLTQTGEEMDNPFPFPVRPGLNFSDTCMVQINGSLMAVQQERGSSPIELWDYGTSQLLATMDDPFVVRQTNFTFTRSGLVLHADYGAMSLYPCAL